MKIMFQFITLAGSPSRKAFPSPVMARYCYEFFHFFEGQESTKPHNFTRLVGNSC